MTDKPSETSPLPLATAAALLGWRGTDRQRRLRRYLERREKLTGMRIMVRAGDGPGQPCSVTVARLRETCPELVGERPDPMVAKFRRYLSTIDQRMDQRVEPIERDVAELYRRTDFNRGMAVELARRLAMILGGCPEEIDTDNETSTEHAADSPCPAGRQRPPEANQNHAPRIGVAEGGLGGGTGGTG